MFFWSLVIGWSIARDIDKFIGLPTRHAHWLALSFNFGVITL